MKAWINHFTLNLGSTLACLYYAIVPPQWTGHRKDELEALEEYSPWIAFLDGLGLFDRKGGQNEETK